MVAGKDRVQPIWFREGSVSSANAAEAVASLAQTWLLHLAQAGACRQHSTESQNTIVSHSILYTVKPHLYGVRVMLPLAWRAEVPSAFATVPWWIERADHASRHSCYPWERRGLCRRAFGSVSFPSLPVTGTRSPSGSWLGIEEYSPIGPVAWDCSTISAFPAPSA